MRIAITGASGFVGRAVVRSVQRRGHVPVLLLRCDPLPATVEGLEHHVIGDIAVAIPPVWPTGLRFEAMIHLASRVHVMHERAEDTEALFQRVNVEGTRRMLDIARAAGASRFVFMSSVKVNGERTAPGVRFSAADAPQPLDAYGRSKCDAERVLTKMCDDDPFSAIALRAPLVFGAGAKGNLPLLMRLAASAVPLPFGAIANRRSMVHVDNLADLAVHCCERAMIPRIAMAGDGTVVSTAELIRMMAEAQGRRARLVPIPAQLIEAAGMLSGRREIARRLLDSLEIDHEETLQKLDWRPPIPVERALAAGLAEMITDKAASLLS
jgi:nucleoside-diphosphate-sugar epimerase